MIEYSELFLVKHDRNIRYFFHYFCRTTPSKGRRYGTIYLEDTGRIMTIHGNLEFLGWFPVIEGKYFPYLFSLVTLYGDLLCTRFARKCIYKPNGSPCRRSR